MWCKDTRPFIRKLFPVIHWKAPPLLSRALKPVTLLGRLSLPPGKVQITHCSRASQWVPRYKLFCVVKKSIGLLTFFPEAMNIARQVTIGDSEIAAFCGPGDPRVAPVLGFGIRRGQAISRGLRWAPAPRLPAGEAGTPPPAFTRNLFTQTSQVQNLWVFSVRT